MIENNKNSFPCASLFLRCCFVENQNGKGFFSFLGRKLGEQRVKKRKKRNNINSHTYR